ncbi:MAG: peroxiredoxin family protein [Bacteroidia bacterium]
MKKVFSIFLLMLCFHALWAQKIDKVGKIVVNQPMPPFSLQDLKGNDWDMSRFTNQITVFYFWLPDTAKIWNDQMQGVGLQALTFKDKGVNFVAPAWGSSERVKEFMKLRNYYMNVLIDDKDWMYNILGIDSFPVIVIVGKNLMVHKIYAGYDEELPKLIKEELYNMLNKNKERED